MFLSTWRWLFAFALLVTSVFSHAGSRGYYVVVIGIHSEDFFNSPSYKIFRDDSPPQLPVATKCWEAGASAGEGVKKIARMDIPAGLSVGMAEAIWLGDKKSAEIAQGILKKRHKNSRPEGFDGLYIVKAEGDKISVIGLGARGKIGFNNPTEKISIRWDKLNPQKTASNLDYALCRASKPFDVDFGV